MSDPVRSYEFSLGRDDVAALVRLRHGGPFEIGLKWFIACAVAAGMAQALLEEFFGAAWAIGQFGAVLIAVALLGLVATWRLWRGRRAAANWPLPARSTVEIWRDHLAATEDGRVRFIAWKTVLAAIYDRRRVILTLDPIEGSVILPRSAFGSDGDLAAFVEFAEARLREGDGEQAEEAGAPPDAPLSVETIITADDVRRVRKHAAGAAMSYAKALGLAALIGAALVGGVASLGARLLGAQDSFSCVWLWGALAGAAGGAVFVGLRLDAAQRRHDGEWTTSAARLTIDADGLAREGDGALSRFAWRRIARIEATADDLLFWIDREMIVAPRRSFASQDSFEAFEQAARRWRSAALTPSAAQEARA